MNTRLPRDDNGNGAFSDAQQPPRDPMPTGLPDGGCQAGAAA